MGKAAPSIPTPDQRSPWALTIFSKTGKQPTRTDIQEAWMSDKITAEEADHLFTLTKNC